MRFVTIGPHTNHDFVARLYLAFHGIPEQSLAFVADGRAGAARVLDGEADYLVLCSVHPQAAEITGRYFTSLFIVDTFISSSKPLAIVRRRGRPRRCLGVFAPTLPYIDESAWPEICVETEGSIVQVSAHLLAGKYDAALVYRDFVEGDPEHFELDRVIGSPDDAWLVFGRERAAAHGPVICSESLVARHRR